MKHFTLCIFAALVALASAGCSDNPVEGESDLDDDFVYQRMHPETVKGILDPGTFDAEELLTRYVDYTRSLGANTFYVYVDYSYFDGKLKYSHIDEYGATEEQQDELERDAIRLIQRAKQQGFAVHLAIAFGGGSNLPFNVPIEQFLEDIRSVDLKWAAIGEQYRVESFAPSSEVDYQMFREYYDTDWSNEAAFREASEISNGYHDDVLPALREVFSGKLVYQAGLYSPYLGSPGYDVFGTGLNSVGRDLDDFRDLAQHVFELAQGAAARQGSDWMVTELWLPVENEEGEMTTPSGTPYRSIRADLFDIAFEEFLAVEGQQPVGLTFTTEFDANTIGPAPSEAGVPDFFNAL